MRPSEIRHRSITRRTSEQYDLFISYNRNDSTRASQLVRELEQRGVRAWMDKLNLAPCELWQTEITEALTHANDIAVLIGASGLGGWQELELQLAFAKQPERKRRIIPVPLPQAPRALTLPDLLAPYMFCDLRADNRAQQIDSLADVLLVDRELRNQPETSIHVEPVPSWLSTVFRVAGKTIMRPTASSTAQWPSEESAQIERLPTTTQYEFTGQEVDEMLQDLEPA